MYLGKYLEADIRELPLPVRIIGRDGKCKFYMLHPSEKTQGASMCGIEEPLHQLLQDKFEKT